MSTQLCDGENRRWSGNWEVRLVIGILCLVSAGARSAPMPNDLGVMDFDHDGVNERVVAAPDGSGAGLVEHWNAGTSNWEREEYGLPDGVMLADKQGRDAGLRFVDLNGDGYPDVLFSNSERYAIHLWSAEIKPHLGWVKGWSQFVRASERRNVPGEPPSLIGARIKVEGGELVVVLPDGKAERLRMKDLIAFEMPAPRSPAEALASFRVRDGFKVELVASEPVVVDPVSLEWGVDGRLWVVEMRDYPLGVDGKGRPGGKIKVLQDADGDGVFERAIPFLEDVPFPSSVMPWKQGALVASAPDLIYAADTDGDGRADKQTVILTGFVPGNQQHRFNGFEWGLDGWIYAANGDSGGTIHSPSSSKTLSISGRDFRFHPESGDVETVSVQTQYGRRRDDWGNWFGNNNPTWLWQVVIPEHYLRRNPKLAVKQLRRVLANYENSTRVYPASAPQIRPNQPWSLNHVTSGCSPSPYRDDWFGPDYATSVFICEPVHNVVHREVLERDGAIHSSRRAEGEDHSEFLASTDNWFRPTTVRTGPDGALYVVDMYRFVLEHPEWISKETQARVDLRAGSDRGRIYRVVPAHGRRRAIPDLSRLEGAGLASAMDSPNGWQRDMVQRRIVEGRDTNAAKRLRTFMTPSFAPQVRVQSLATLGLLDQLDPALVVGALRDPNPWVRAEALRQSERLVDVAPGLFPTVAALARDGDAAVRLQAAFTLGAWPTDVAEPILRGLALSDGGDEWIRTAILSSASPDGELFGELHKNEALPKAGAPLAGREPSSPDRAAVIAGYAGVNDLPGDGDRGRQVFSALCAPCHRLKGIGTSVGPDLGMASSKPAEWFLSAILDPGAAVEARYQGWAVKIREGETLEGLVAAETANNIVLRMAGGLEHAILRTNIVSMAPMKGSMMPGGFESVIPRSGMADLLQWMRKP